MTVAARPELMTTEQMLALPDEGKERWLIRGELKGEGDDPSESWPQPDADADPHEDRFLTGVPVLIVEILSPSDQHEEITEKVASYLEAGVKLAWVVDPRFRTITVYRADAEPELFNVKQSISGDPHLPGFQVAVKDVFTR